MLLIHSKEMSPASEFTPIGLIFRMGVKIIEGQCGTQSHRLTLGVDVLGLRPRTGLRSLHGDAGARSTLKAEQKR